MNIYLSGMIGAGKSTLGGAIADRLALPMHDLDREMDEALGYSFHRLVAEQGWLAFRELEYSICKRFAGLSGRVCCLGGGTVRYEWNRDVLCPSGVIVLLEASPETLVERVRHADRPRVNAGTSLDEDVTRLWKETGRKYYDAADIVFSTEEIGVAEAAERLLETLAGEPRLSSLFSSAGRGKQ